MPKELNNAMDPLLIASVLADPQDIISLNEKILEVIPEQKENVVVEYNGLNLKFSKEDSRRFIAMVMLQVLTPKNISAIIGDFLWYKFNNIGYETIECSDLLKKDLIKIMDGINFEKE